MGRFLNLDPSWQEENLYQYSRNNPIHDTDPSGLIPEPPVSGLGRLDLGKSDADAAIDKVNKLQNFYDIRIIVDFGWEIGFGATTVYGTELPLGTHFIPYNDPDRNGYLAMSSCSPNWIEGNWDLREIELVEEAVEKIASVFERDNPHSLSGDYLFRKAMGKTTILRSSSQQPSRAYSYGFISRISLTDRDFNLSDGEYHEEWTVVHEFGHKWDAMTSSRLSTGMMNRVLQRQCTLVASGDLWCETVYQESPPGPREGQYARTNSREDWAQAFAAYILPSHSYVDTGRIFGDLPTTGLGSIREDYVFQAIRGI